MNYKAIYNNLILKAGSSKRLGDVEIHHILPRCLGGTDDSSNLVSLSAREHYVAHQLLVKIYPDNPKLWYAANMMLSLNGRKYEWMKSNFRKIHSQHMKELYKSGQFKGNFGSKHSPETKKRISEAISHPQISVTCPKCGKKGGHQNMTRYHFENCGKRKQSTCPHCMKIGSDTIMKRWHFDNCKSKVANL